LRLKPNAPEAFKIFKVAAEDESQKRMREVMTDNARELSMGGMRQTSEQEGIKHHTSVRYSPESNGVAEHTIGVLTNPYVPCRRIPAFPNVHNRTSTRTLGGRTPYEVLYGVKQDVSHLHAFGASCAIVEPKERLRKLDDRTTMCFFVRYKYDGGGYRV